MSTDGCRSLQLPHTVIALAVSSDGAVAVALGDGRVVVTAPNADAGLTEIVGLAGVPVSCLAFGGQGDAHLAAGSVGATYILRLRSELTLPKDPMPPLRLASPSSPSSLVASIALAGDSSVIAAASGSSVGLFRVAEAMQSHDLRHEGEVVDVAIVDASFGRLLVSCSSTARDFAVWSLPGDDGDDPDLLHRGGVRSAAAPTRLTVLHGARPQLAIGLANGDLHVFALSFASDGSLMPEEIVRLSIATVVHRWHVARGIEPPEAPCSSDDEPRGVLALGSSASAWTDTLAVAVPAGLAVFNAATLDVVAFHGRHAGLAALIGHKDGFLVVASARCGASEVTVATVNPLTTVDDHDSASGPSMVPDTAPPPNSALAPRRRTAQVPGRGARGQGGVDAPVTFRRNVSSSGYGVVQPKITMGRRPPPPRQVPTRRSSAVGPASGPGLSAQPFDRTSSPPSTLWIDYDASGGAAGEPAQRVSWSPTGRRIAVASGRNVRTPLLADGEQGRRREVAFRHDAIVASVSWSLCGRRVLTAAGRECALWNAGDAAPLVCIARPSPRRGTAAVGRSTPEWAAAQFFQRDRLILSAAGSRLCLWSLSLDKLTADSDIAAAQATNSARLLLDHALEAQAATDVVAANSYLSHLALVATSARTVEVVDLARGATVRVFRESHERPVVRLALNDPPIGTDHGQPSEALNLFATSAADGCVRLWDVRSLRALRTFRQHASGRGPAGVAFSPCLRFIACGSSDPHAVVYDIRSGGVLDRLRTGEAPASDVSWHPTRPSELAVASLDGRVRVFRPLLPAGERGSRGGGRGGQRAGPSMDRIADAM